jgi:hypothetical protein
MAEVLLHIGTEKTGTTSVQRFLEANEETLVLRGIHYSRTAGRRQNWKLPLIGLARLHNDLGLRLAVSTSDFLREQKNLREALAKEIRHVAGNRLIFSSELIHSRLPSRTEVEDFRDALTGVGISRCRILLYIREPAEAANSLFSTSLRAGSTLAEPPAPGTNSYYDNICNHRETLERWCSAFGQEAVQVRLFRRDRLVGQSIVDDFCEASGVDASGCRPPEHMNASLSELDAALLWRLNRRLPARRRKQEQALRGNLEAFFQRHSELPAYRMPQTLWDAYRAYYAESNEWVRKRFFPQEEELFPVLEPSVDDFELPDDRSLDSMADLLYRIWVNKHGRSL